MTLKLEPFDDVLPDSTVWIDYLNERVTSPEKDFLMKLVLGGYDIWVCPPVFQEVLQGARSKKELTIACRAFRKCFRGRMGIYKVAEYGAEIYRTLRTQGITIRKPNDCLIAAYCILNGLALLHHDHDFDQIEQHFPLVVVR
ncbi:MAG: PIN domain-containing protein [Spirochaetaceae bacterium]|jgi:predicted nucleic acid-binding protein|nr:PIN domain-containing protein [Spirochaetaceae bacterium]